MLVPMSIMKHHDLCIQFKASNGPREAEFQNPKLTTTPWNLHKSFRYLIWISQMNGNNKRIHLGIPLVKMVMIRIKLIICNKMLLILWIWIMLIAEVAARTTFKRLKACTMKIQRYKLRSSTSPWAFSIKIRIRMACTIRLSFCRRRSKSKTYPYGKNNSKYMSWSTISKSFYGRWACEMVKIKTWAVRLQKWILVLRLSPRICRWCQI